MEAGTFEDITSGSKKLRQATTTAAAVAVAAAGRFQG